MPNEASASPSPPKVTNVTGMPNVHLTMPIPLRNSATSGLITKQLIIMPVTIEIIIAGINDSAVCNISCLVVKPRDFKIP